MSSYETLARLYDRLTGDVRYDLFADHYESEFIRIGGEFKLILDVCCGTGTLTGIMQSRGYDMIAADGSEEMLMEARDKYYSNPVSGNMPLFLCQKADELDLYGTVDAAYCSLDGVNYLSDREFNGMLSCLKHFIRPGGLFIFDVRTEDFFKNTDGRILVDEDDEMLCLWRADYYPESMKMIYGMDIFIRDEKGNDLWTREKEEHTEFLHRSEDLEIMLKKHSFDNIEITTGLLEYDPERLFITAQRI